MPPYCGSKLHGKFPLHWDRDGPLTLELTNSLRKHKAQVPLILLLVSNSKCLYMSAATHPKSPLYPDFLLQAPSCHEHESMGSPRITGLAIIDAHSINLTNVNLVRVIGIILRNWRTLARKCRYSPRDQRWWDESLTFSIPHDTQDCVVPTSASLVLWFFSFPPP